MEASATTDLVSFAAPPVNEVYLSVQFAEPVVDEAAALVDFWPQVRESYPQHERHPPLMRLAEEFGRREESPRIPFQVSEDPLPQRYWFISEAGTRLIQVQPDRFVFNWRKLEEGQEYPRYSTLRPEFEENYHAFIEAIPEDKRLVSPDLCEISYTNHIEAGQNQDDHPIHLSQILRLVAPPVEGAVPAPEQMQIASRSLLRSDGEPFGRFYLTAAPALRASDGVPIYVLQLTVRGVLRSGELDEIIRFFDRGRELIVNGFAEITTDEMHEIWGMERA